MLAAGTVKPGLAMNRDPIFHISSVLGDTRDHEAAKPRNVYQNTQKKSIKEKDPCARGRCNLVL